MLIGHLDILLLKGEITEEEYQERRKKRTEMILEMYIKGIISIEEMYEKLNQ